MTTSSPKDYEALDTSALHVLEQDPSITVEEWSAIVKELGRRGSLVPSSPFNPRILYPTITIAAGLIVVMFLRPSFFTLLLTLPPVLGCITVLLGPPGVVRWINRRESFFLRMRNWSQKRATRFRKYFVAPLAAGSLRAWHWTNANGHEYVKAGIRLCAMLWFWSLMVALFLAAVYAVIIVIMMMVVFTLAYWVLRITGLYDGPGLPKRKNRNNPLQPLGMPQLNDGKVYRIDPKTGLVQTRGFFGWDNTDMRVDPASGVVQERAFIGWDNSDTRVDPASGVIQERDFIGWKEGEHRIDPKTGEIQEKDFLGWKQGDERIDPKTGVRQKRDFIGWSDANS